jgi:lipopolysaccharide/colanic/teichoic acid biosynthesis glycosyltransferase
VAPSGDGDPAIPGTFSAKARGFAVRQAFDAICAAIVLLLVSPLLVFIALAIKLEDRGPIFYAHRRLGRNFRRFGLLKFRTMVANADRLGGPITVAGDRRITRVGRFLRDYKLDELPQLWNVVVGDIQLVGARPEYAGNAERFRAEYEELLRDRPGITDPATLAYRDEEKMLGGDNIEEQYFTRILPHKLQLSLEYARRRTFFSDLGIIFRTLLRLHQPAREAKSDAPSANDPEGSRKPPAASEERVSLPGAK